jgi:hypothetical protein
MNELWLQLPALFGLSLFLLGKQRQRWRAQELDSARQMTGRGFEAQVIKTHLEELRQHQPTSVRQRKRQTPAHEEFTQTVRESLCRRSFFHARKENHPADDLAALNSAGGRIN